MSRDPIVEAIDEVEEAAATLHRAVDAVTDRVDPCPAAPWITKPVTAIVQHLLAAGGRQLRLLPMEASGDFERLSRRMGRTQRSKSSLTSRT